LDVVAAGFAMAAEMAASDLISEAAGGHIGFESTTQFRLFLVGLLRAGRPGDYISAASSGAVLTSIFRILSSAPHRPPWQNRPSSFIRAALIMRMALEARLVLGPH